MAEFEFVQVKRPFDDKLKVVSRPNKRRSQTVASWIVASSARKWNIK